MAVRKNKRKGWATLKIRIPESLLERFKAKIPPGRRSSYVRTIIDQMADDVNFLEIEEVQLARQLSGLRAKITDLRLQREENYRKKEMAR